MQIHILSWSIFNAIAHASAFNFTNNTRGELSASQHMQMIIIIVFNFSFYFNLNENEWMNVYWIRVATYKYVCNIRLLKILLLFESPMLDDNKVGQQ